MIPVRTRKKGTDVQVQGEVSWKNACTYDVFSEIWKVKGTPLSGKRHDILGHKYNKFTIPLSGLEKLRTRLSKLDPSSSILVS